MAARRYDRQAIVEGRLHPFRGNTNVARAPSTVLHESSRTLLRAMSLHIQHSDGHRGVTIKLERFSQKDDEGMFTQLDTLSLGERAVAALFDYMDTQETLKDIPLGGRFVLTDGELVPAEMAQELAALIDGGKLTSESLANIHAAAQHAAYLSALTELQQLLDEDDRECTYQKWFAERPWVFGTSYVGRVDKRIVGLHEQVDIILKTADGYLDIIELKKPSMEPLRAVKHGQKTFWCWSADASQAVGQCADYLRCVEEKRHELQADEGLPFIKPRARVVIGRTRDWESGKHAALRTLNAALHGVEVWTYDHVLTMARQLVACYESSCPEVGSEQYEDDEDPFGDQ